MSYKLPSHIDKEEFWKSSKRLTNEQLAEKYKVNVRTIYKWKSEARGKVIEIPGPLGKIYNDSISLISDKFMVLGDVEIPNHDTEILEIACKVAKRFKIKDLILNGDFVVLDCFSSWMRSTVYKLAFEDELEVAVEVIRELLKQFKLIVWITGNHERRLVHLVDGHISIGDFFKDMSGVEITEYAHCNVKSNGKDIMITHQKEYGRVSNSTAKKLTGKFLKNIIAGHNHHQSFGFHESGEFWAVDGGHCRDVSRTRYKNVRVTTHPMWNLGFTIVIDGYPYLINKQNADFWLNI